VLRDILLISVLIIWLALAFLYPPITDDGVFLKPPAGPDPLNLYMSWEKSAVLPYEENTGYATYQYAFCYPIPAAAAMEVDVSPEVARPTIVVRHGIPLGIEFSTSPTNTIDILDNIGYTSGWKFRYDWTYWCDEGYKQIVFETYAHHDDKGKVIRAGVGDPIGPDLLEPTEYASFIVTGTGGLSVSSSNTTSNPK